MLSGSLMPSIMLRPMPRRLGQHFLHASAVESLVDIVRPRPDNRFLEIGPGHGALTVPLAMRSAAVTAVEIDGALVAKLKGRVPANVEIVQADALTADLRALAPAGTRLVGNLPYYISSPLLRRFLELRDLVPDAHVMLQEEVADRVAAGPGSRDYGILSVLLGLWADLDVVLRLPPAAFDPPPKVRSAVLRIRFLTAARAPVPSLEALELLLKKAFARRRRTLENNLQDSYPNLKEHLRLLNIEGRRRPETLSVGEFAALATALATP
jgi:16S rRNA (adenine1518-N6/adenine1519-N6)-dimethyltransferase